MHPTLLFPSQALPPSQALRLATAPLSPRQALTYAAWSKPSYYPPIWPPPLLARFMSEDAAVLAPGSGQLLDYAGACTRVQCMCSACATQAGPAPPRPAPPPTPYAPLPRFTRRAADLLRRVLRHVLELAAPPRRARPLRQRGRRRVRAPRRRAVERRAVREPHDRLVLLHPRVGLRPAQGVAAARVDARLRVQELAPDGDLVTCFPCAEGACCGCLRRRRHSLWPPFSPRALAFGQPLATLPSSYTQARLPLVRARQHGPGRRGAAPLQGHPRRRRGHGRIRRVVVADGAPPRGRGD